MKNKVWADLFVILINGEKGALFRFALAQKPARHTDKGEKMYLVNEDSFMKLLFVFSFIAIIPFVCRSQTNKPEQADTVSKNDSAKTTVEIYFTDETKKKFYQITPIIIWTKTYTGEIIKTYQHSIDALGNPVPLDDIPPGLYNLTVGKKQEIRAQKILVSKGKRNLIYVHVKNRTLLMLDDNTY